MSKDDRVNEILSRYGEDMSATWMVQGQRVIRHQALERIAIKANIRFYPPEFLRKEEREAVLLVSGVMDSAGGRVEWSIGEANMELNYRTSGKQQAYPYAMAEKRAKDRVILKLIALHGLVYSEEEADDFKASAPPANDREAVMQEAVDGNVTVDLEDGEVSPFNAMRRMIDQKTSVNALTEFMLSPATKSLMACWSDKDYIDVKEYATRRLVELGWKSTKGPRE